jgi:enediyne biosynthesis protein E5
MDPRFFQISFLGILLLVGVFLKDFSIQFFQIFLTFSFGFLTQTLWTRFLKLNAGYLSAFVTCLGTSILLRADSNYIHPIIITLAISSKFILRINDKHIFNPAMFGVILAINFFPGSWISTGQWGFEIYLSSFLFFLGFIVTSKARVGIISLSFLVFYFGFLFYRIQFFGYSKDVFYHQIQNGSLILFSFFMISDPMTSPNHNYAKIIHTFIVAFIAYLIAYKFFKPNALVWALFISSPVVLFLDKIFKKQKYTWLPKTSST